MAPHPIRVLPRLAAECRTPLTGEVCISIRNPRQSIPSVAHFGKVLSLAFHDTDRVGGGFTVMSAEDAKAVILFMTQHRNSPLTVHCEFGASRSVAVGIFLAAWLARPLYIVATDVLMPNPWVLNQLRAAAVFQGLRLCDFRLLACGVLGVSSFLPDASLFLGNKAQ